MWRRFICLTAFAWILAVCCPGCGRKSTPLETDPSKTPWLDPQAKIKALKQSDQRIRGLAAAQLGEMGAKAADALPELERLANNDPEPKVRQRAKEAIEKIRAATGTGPPQ
jgi:hypothetical protein